MSMDPISAASAAALDELRTIPAPAVDADPAPTAMDTTETVAPTGDDSATSSADVKTTEDSSSAEDKTPQSPSEEEELEILHNQQAVKLPKSEVLKLAQKGFDYTRKTMSLAEERRAFDAERLTAQAEIQRQLLVLKDTLTDPNSLRELVQWAAAQQGMELTDQQAAQAAASVTPQQAQQMISSQVQRLEQQLGTAVARAQHEIETNRLEKEYSATINTHLLNLTTAKYPVLQDVEGIDRLLREEVGAQVKSLIDADPTREIPMDQTLKMLEKAAERRAAKIESRFKERLKETAVKQAKLTSTGIEPAGGGAPKPTPGATPKLGSKELTALVYQDLGAAPPRW